MKKIFLSFCLVFFFLAACGQNLTVAVVGEPAPNFVAIDLKGKSWTLFDLKGKVVLINFWATWCPPCVQEMPSMQRLRGLLPEDQFVILTILNKDDPAMARVFSEKFGITVPILDDRENLIGPKYGLTGVPETFIVDKEGILQKKMIGPAEWDSLEIVSYISQYLK